MADNRPGAAVRPGETVESTGAKLSDMLSGAFADAKTFSWSEFLGVGGLCCVPALVLVLLAGVGFNTRPAAMVIATGTLIAGYGSFQHLTERRTPEMLLVTAGMSLSAAIGTLANAQILLETMSIGVWSFALGLAMVIAQPLGWLMLQCTIALIVAAAFPSDLLHAAYRALLLAAGGILQTGMIVGLASLLPGLLPPEADSSTPSTSLRLRVLLSEVADIMARRVNGLAFAVGLTIAAIMGNIAARLLDLPNGYWVPMTVVLIMRPVARETASRAVARLAGTVIGAGMITVLMALLRPPMMVVTALICLAAWGCFGLQRVNYMALSFCVTAYVASLFAYDGLPEPVVALHRTLATALGGGLALLIHGAGQWIAAYSGRSATPSRQAP